MAVALLERETETKEKQGTQENCENIMTSDERHNLRIKENYAKLINPESRPKDIIVTEPPVQKANIIDFAPVQEAEKAEPEVYLVENARADADIFRADSAINRKTLFATAAVATTVEEEENEDLRPTQTTIQYKTTALKTNVEEGKISTKSTTSKKLWLTKKDKIIIAIALSVIVTLFTLIIVNSAVISSLNNEVSTLQTTLYSVEDSYYNSLEEINTYFDESNLAETVNNFAIENGMVRK